MKVEIRQENVKMLAEVHLSLVKIRKKVRTINKKMEEHNHNNNHQKFYVVKDHAKKSDK